MYVLLFHKQLITVAAFHIPLFFSPYFLSNNVQIFDHVLFSYSWTPKRRATVLVETNELNK